MTLVSDLRTRLARLSARRGLLGGVADAGGVHLELRGAGDEHARAHVAVDEPERQRIGVLAVEDRDDLVALVLGQLLEPGRDLVLAGDHEDGEAGVALAHAAS